VPGSQPPLLVPVSPATCHAIPADGDISGHPSASRFLLVAIVFLVLIIGGGLPTPLYVLYQHEWHFSSGILTVIFAAYSLGLLITLVLFRRTSDRIGRRTVLMAAIAVAIASTGLFLLAQSVPWLVAARIFSGISVGLAAPTASAALTESEPSGNRQRAAGVTAILTALGVGLGPFYAGLLAQFAPDPLTLAFWVLLGMLVAALAAALAIPDVRPSPSPGSATSGRGFQVPREIRRVFVLSAIAGFCGFALAGIFSGLAPSFLASDLGIRDPAIGGANVLLLFGSAAIAQVLARGTPSRRVARWGASAGPLGLFSIALAVWTRIPWPFFVGTVLCGTGFGLLLMGGLGMLNQVAPADRRGEVLSGFYFAGYLGLAIPVVGIGITSDSWGLPVGIAVFATIIIVLLVIFLLARGDTSQLKRPLTS
jgi:predicted MFS family arabinose efflux permease